MPYVNSKEMLQRALKGGYAVGAFNAENMETAQAIIFAASVCKAPVIIQTTPGSVKYAGYKVFAAMVKAIAEDSDAKVVLHADHTENYEDCKKAIDAGYTSVMIDGSKLPLADNIALTARVAEYARGRGVTAEGELGMLAGKEDGLVNLSGSCTDPAEAVRFARETGVDSLAIAIGTAHGFYKGKPVLNIPLISEISSLIPGLPLVLHGASGLRVPTVKECIAGGMAKVNFATEFRAAFTNAVREKLLANTAAYDPKSYLGAGRTAARQFVESWIRALGSENKAA